MGSEYPTVDLSHLPLTFLESYPFPAFVLYSPAADPTIPRPRLTSRDTDSTVRNNRNEDISPFTEVPKESATPPSERDDFTKVVWSNEKWKVLTRSKDLFEVENTPELLSWIRSGSVDKPLSVGFRHASTRYHMAKTRAPPAAIGPGSFELTIITGQPIPTAPMPTGTDLTNSPIPEMEEFSLDDHAGSSRRSTIRSSGLAANRLSTSTDHSSFSVDPSSSRSSQGSSYFPSQSQRSSSARARNAKGRLASVKDTEAYNAHMTEAAASCWQMMERVDWSNTKLGPRSGWTDQINGLLAIVFQSPSQDSLWLGEDLQILYNVPYTSLLSDHQAFGKPASEIWASLWDYLKPMIDLVIAGESVFRENDCLSFRTYGNGIPCESHHDWRYVPIRANDGSVIGLFNQSIEKTEQVLAERRLDAVRSLSEQMLVVRSMREYYDSIIEVLEEHPKDAPFVMCYSVKPQPQNTADNVVTVSIDLERSVGVPEHHPSAPKHLIANIPSKSKSIFGPNTAGLSSPTLSAISALSSGSNRIHHYVDASQAWPIQKALATRQCVVVNDCRDLIKDYPIRVWDELPISAIVVPICSDSSTEVPESVLILGLNVRRPFDADYDSWVHVIRSHLASSHTSVKAIEAEKKRIDDQVRMEKAKTAWFRGAAHDLRSPLALVSGPLDDVLHSDLMPKQKTSLSIAKRNVDRLMRLVDSLMDFSRLEAGKVEGRFVPTELLPFITELANLFRPAIERQGIDLILDLEPSNITVYVDPTLFETVVSNLLGNAMKHTESGQITVRLRYTESAEISIIDTGIGIPQDELQHITEVFHRATNAVHTGTQGTGLGLSIVREILHLHEGSLEIASKTGSSVDDHSHGSTFTAKIPLKERRVALAGAQVPAFGKYGQALANEAMRWKRDGASTEGSSSEVGVESSIGSHSKLSDGLMFEPDDTLLIVDDNTDLREYVKGIFSSYCKVREASNGEAGLRMAIENPPSLVLCDVLMPKMSGMELLTALRNEKSTRITPIVMLSAVSGDEARVDALMNGAEDYMTKPFKPKELLARVHLHMQVGKKRRLLEDMYSQRQTELALLSDYCPSGIMRANAEGIVTYANAAWRAMAGMSVDADPSSWPDFVDEDNKAMLYPAWGRFLSGKETQVRLSWKWLNGQVSSGLFIRLDLVMPGMTGILGCINDVTHEEMRIVEAEKRRIEAEESKHQQELLVDLTSHEIRTPVSAILQCSSLVKENLVALTEQLKLAGPLGFHPSKDLLDDMAEDVEALESIYQCGLVQERIAGDVLSLARIQLDMLSLHDVETDLRKEAKKVLSVFSSEAKMKKIELKLQFGETIEQARIAKIKTDHVRLGQVVTNLISNAIRFTASSDVRNITVQYDVSFLPPEEDTCALPPSIGLPADLPVPEDTPMWLFVSVKDTGPGLGPNELAILFKRFSQGNKMIHTRYGGSGLGLFICRKITELLGGRIEVRSELGHGSTFRFFVKISAAAPKSLLAAYIEATSSNPPVQSNGTGTPLSSRPSSGSVPTVQSSATPPPQMVAGLQDLHILIVEDNIINQTVLKRQITKAGLTCDVADNGLIALNLIHEAHRQSKRAGPARKRTYDCVLMDLEMPVMDGLTAVREIRNAEQKGTLNRQMVVALTGNARQGQIDQAMEAGMDDVVIKPYVLTNLLKKIREMSETRRREEERALEEL